MDELFHKLVFILNAFSRLIHFFPDFFRVIFPDLGFDFNACFSLIGASFNFGGLFFCSSSFNLFFPLANICFLFLISFGLSNCF